MSFIATLLPKLALFVVTAVVGATVATVAVSATQDHAPASTAGVAPDYLLAAGSADTPGGTLPVAFNLAPTDPQPSPMATLPPADLALAATALLGSEPTRVLNPTGFPRIPPITQFDGGPFQNANCTLTSGAMLARLGYGIVTSGSTLRTLQDDQVGGTGLDDLGVALWRGYGVAFPSGLIPQHKLKALLAAGFGAVIQGDYSKVPEALRLQASFTGTHAIYLDGYFPGDSVKGIPEAYYVIDPLGRPHAGYEGDWWPASVIDAFGTSFGGGRVAAMWAFPPGGVPPDVVGPDVLPIPSSGGAGPAPTLAPGASPTPTPAPGATPTPAVAPEPGDTGPSIPAAWSAVERARLGDVIAIPELTLCLFEPKPPGCPTGIEGTFRVPQQAIQFHLGPKVEVVFVDSDRPNVAMVGFTVDPAAPATVNFWNASGTPATIGTPSSMSSAVLSGKNVMLARLDVLASTTYRYQVVSGSGLFAGESPIGEFTTGGGVQQFGVSLSAAANPAFRLVTGLSPYLHPAPDGFARPMVRMQALGGVPCLESALFGGTSFCVDTGSAPVASCTRAEVTYALAGITATGVLVRAYPDVGEVAPGGGSLDGVLEVSGDAPSGTVSIGCLASGLTYNIALDAVGDDAGILASETITVP